MEDAQTARRPKVKKESSLTMRMTRDTRETLEAAADQEGRSVSEMAERWLEAARGLAVQPGLADVARQMAAFADAMRRRDIGDPTEDSIARETLRRGWAFIAGGALPFTPKSDLERELEAARLACRSAAEVFRQELASQYERTPDDPMIAASLRRPVGNVFARRPVGRYDAQSLADLLVFLEQMGDRPDAELFAAVYSGLQRVLDEVKQSEVPYVPEGAANAFYALLRAMGAYTEADEKVSDTRRDAYLKAMELVAELRADYR